MSNAAVAAYEHYAGRHGAVAGWQVIASFSGWATFLRTPSNREFGIVLQSDADPAHIIVSFRGSIDKLDFYHDAWIKTTTFKPFNGSRPSNSIDVSDGFWSLYADYGQFRSLSMQNQLMNIMIRLVRFSNVTKVSVCGHSLGGALASLFAFDFRNSEIFNDVVLDVMTFASPRVGLASWERAYTDRGLEGLTTRIYNYEDWVPSLPPSTYPISYRHVGQPFQINSYAVDHYFKDAGPRHSMKNYRYVLDQALDVPDQVYIGDYPDQSGDTDWIMTSVELQDGAQPEWFAIKAAMRHDPDFCAKVQAELGTVDFFLDRTGSNQ